MQSDRNTLSGWIVTPSDSPPLWPETKVGTKAPNRVEARDSDGRDYIVMTKSLAPGCLWFCLPSGYPDQPRGLQLFGYVGGRLRNRLDLPVAPRPVVLVRPVAGLDGGLMANIAGNKLRVQLPPSLWPTLRCSVTLRATTFQSIKQTQDADPGPRRQATFDVFYPTNIRTASVEVTAYVDQPVVSDFAVSSLEVVGGRLRSSQAEKKRSGSAVLGLPRFSAHHDDKNGVIAQFSTNQLHRVTQAEVANCPFLSASVLPNKGMISLSLKQQSTLPDGPLGDVKMRIHSLVWGKIGTKSFTVPVTHVDRLDMK